MCNIPCSICADYDECEIRYHKPFKYNIYTLVEKKDHENIFHFSGILECTKEQAQEITFLNPNLSLVIDNTQFNDENNENTIL